MPKAKELQVLTKPDLDGRLLAMIKTVADYARESGALSPMRIDAISKYRSWRQLRKCPAKRRDNPG
jgi:hypothetical protein